MWSGVEKGWRQSEKRSVDRNRGIHTSHSPLTKTPQMGDYEFGILPFVEDSIYMSNKY
jgi:hypothetical protein